ncbi:hypothetical protein AS589_03440 [Empedobacter brevis]|nr:hypothetical protein AS589_03440 [Empedobacter brevis]
MNLWAQNLDYVPKIAPPSPEAYKLSRYGDIQLQGNTGAFSHSIPIYTILFHEINLPVTLAYSSNGVLVDELSGFIGTSWSLNAGGVISRTVRGVPDEKAQERWYPDSIEPLNTNAAKIKLYADKDNVTRDSQQDWFFVNIGNISMSFFFDENLNILKSNDDDTKIEYTRKTTTTFGSVMEFKITDKNGTVYILGGDEDYLESNTMSQDCIVGPKTTYYSAWYLKEIITPNKQKMTFTYNSYQQSFTSSASYNETYTPVCDKNIEVNTVFNRYSSNCRTSNETSSKALASISYGDNKILFDYKNDRKDEGGLLLNNIFIYNKTQLIKREELVYDEYYSNKTISDYKLTNNPSIRYRYFLKEIRNYNSSNVYNNKYSFDYYNASELPPRLSWSKDIYGYYNNKLNSSPFDKNLKTNEETIDIVKNHPTNFSGDLSVDPTTTFYGMLKSITYPSGGISTVNYESSFYTVPEIDKVYDHHFFSVGKNACGEQYEPAEKYFDFISNGQPIHFETYPDLYELCNGVTVDRYNTLHVQIYDLTTNTLIYGGGGDYKKKLRTAKEKERPNGDNVVAPIITKKGNQYRILINVDSRHGHLRATAEFKYNLREETRYVKKYYGGVRVKSIEDFDNAKSINKKEYIYNAFQERNSEFTTIKELNTPKLFEKNTYTMYCSMEGSSTTNMAPVYNAIKLSVNNSSINQLFNTRSQNVSYGIITTLSSNNTQNNGYTENYFYNNSDYINQTYQGTKIYGTPTSNNSEGYASSLLKTKVYNSNHLLVRETENIYNSIKNNKTFTSWVFKKNYDVFFGVTESFLENISIERYQNFSRTVKPTKTITKEHFPNGTVTTETNYNYDSANHLQLTSQTTQNSKGETTATEYQYPPDWAGNTMADKLTAQNRISEPLTIVQKNNGIVVSAVYNEYNEFNGANGIVQKSRVFQKKGSDQFVEGDDIIAYNSYDAKGNLTQYTLKNGISVAIIWGYGGQYPVAKIEGAALSQISNSTISTLNNSTSDADLLNALSALRTAHKDAMVTGYLYKPLVGVTQIIQPNGMTEKYNYDAANRLQSIVNDQNEVIKTFEYNYKQP